jgi:hypothetical protein
VTSTATGELIAEVDKTEGRLVRLALDPGRYLVRKPEGSFVRIGDVLVLPDSLTMLDEAGMDELPYAEVARRGAGPRRTWVGELGFGVHTGSVDGAGLTPAVGVALLRERGPWTFAIGLELAYVEFAAQQLATSQRECWGRLDARLRWPVSWILPYLGMSFGVGWIHQSFQRPQERVIREVFGSRVPDIDGVAGRLLLTGGLELPISGVVTLRLEGGGGGNLANTQGGLRMSPAAQAALSVGLRF